MTTTPLLPRGKKNFANGPRLLVTVPEAANALSISRRSVYRLIGLGLLQSVKCGRACRVTMASLETFVARGGCGT